MALDRTGCPVAVIGAAGFLGQAILGQLAARGVARVAVSRQCNDDLVHEADASRMDDDRKPVGDAQPTGLRLAKLPVEGEMVGDIPLLFVAAADEGKTLLSAPLPGFVMVHQG